MTAYNYFGSGSGAYDVMSACQTLFQGLVIEQPLLHAATTCWKAKGAPLDSNDITTILAAVRW